ncbi:CobW family GTP-binding protein [Novosphingobium sp. 9]|uniref:CobW family GTP-binding protein n=1 Tax=Novosphingobium sp. 9 TaxID=2025349 RepID=UPI0021B54FA8|nr:GTP-binding protein [Novosphingobium sp. 9]
MIEGLPRAPIGSDPIEVVLVTGFLGTGKTSLIRAALESVDTARTGVIVNEAGDTDFDGIQIAEATGGMSAIRMLGNGCLCCEAQDDLAEAIRALVARHLDLTGLPSERIIVEASGLARPGRLLRQFQQLRELPLRVRVVATVDAMLIADPERHGEIAAQWAAAGTLVLTRGDMAADGGARAMAMAQAINPLAVVVTQGSQAERAAALFEAGGPTIPALSDAPETAPSSSGHGRVRAVTLRQRPGVSWDACAEWLDNLGGIGGERVLRVKGLVSPVGSDRSWLVQAVGTTFAVPTAIPRTPHGHMVVIGEEIDAAFLAEIEPQGLFDLPDSDHSHDHHANHPLHYTDAAHA